MQISENLKEELLKFLKKNKKADVVTTYLFFLEKKLKINPILCYPRYSSNGVL